MVQCRTNYAGCDTMNITTHSNFNFTSELLSQHEDASIVGRPDIVMLLQQKIRSGQISPELADCFIKHAQHRYKLHQLQNYTQGSTYVSFKDMIKIHLFQSNGEQKILYIKDSPENIDAWLQK